MPIRPSDELDNPGPDGSRVVVGDEGLPVRQDSGVQIQRIGVPGAEANWDVDQDLVGDGDYEADPTTVGGTSELSGAVESTDDETFTVEIQWQDSDDESVLYTESDEAMTDTTDLIIESVTTKGDNCKIVITDTSGADQNNVKGTFNFH